MKKQQTIIYLILLSACFLFIVSVMAQTQGPELTLIWSTDAYIPFNYRGKALPTKNSLIETVGIISSTNIAAQDFNYYWYLDGRFKSENSGQDKQIFKFKAINKAHTIKLRVEDKNKAVSLLKTVEIKIVSPQIKINSQTLQLKTGEEKQFVALPYFFNIKNLNELSYNWKMGKDIAESSGSRWPNILNIKIGQIPETIFQDLKVEAENKNDLSQKAEDSVEIILKP